MHEIRKRPRSIRLMVSLVLFALMSPAALGIPWIQDPQKPNVQRPRRVGENTTDNKTTSSPNEEVDEGDVVRVETQLVSVPAVVTDASGRPLSGLTQKNFQVFEDGQAQTITNFGTADAPFEIALLLDTSGSTREDIGLIRQAAISFVEMLRPGDRVAVVAFGTVSQGQEKLPVVDVLEPLTSDRSSLRTAIGNLGASNGTPYYDAMRQIGDTVFREPPRDEVRGRRAIVALTDGVDSASESDFNSAKMQLTRAGLACYFVQVNTEDYVEDRLMKDCQDDGRLTLSQKQLQRYRQLFAPKAKAEDYVNFCQMGPFERMSISRELYNLARKEMNDLARVSGGKSFVAASLSDARAAFGRVAADIGTLYSIGYYPTNKARDGKYRAIRLDVKGVKGTAQVRARDGYYAPRQ